jgi:polysaccharide export outer membrane protein
VKVVVRAIVALGVAALGSGCTSLGEYVWADQAQAQAGAAATQYLIGPGDRLTIRVFGQGDVSGPVRVREDGRFSLPMMSDQQAAGLSTSDLADMLQAHLKSYFKHPVVTVALEERRPCRVSVIGQVATPGVFELEPGRGVLQAVAQAGGLTRLAHQDRIFLLRQGTESRPPMRVRFRYRDLLDAEPRSAAFQLQDGDVLVVQ